MGLYNITGRYGEEMELRKVVEEMVHGIDFAAMTKEERVEHYVRLCDSLGLNPYTAPFRYIRDRQGKLRLYATKDCAAQLSAIHEVSITNLRIRQDTEKISATVIARMPGGRSKPNGGSVSIAGKRGQDIADAEMHAITKAIRRATLDILGLGMLDESEVHSIEDELVAAAQYETGIDALDGITTPGRKIGTGELRKFHAIAKSQDWTKAEIAVLLARFGYRSPGAIPRGSMFDEILRALTDVVLHEQVRSQLSTDNGTSPQP